MSPETALAELRATAERRLTGARLAAYLDQVAVLLVLLHRQLAPDDPTRPAACRPCPWRT